MRRRDFLRSALSAGICAHLFAKSALSSVTGAVLKKKPNVLVIVTDQQNGGMLSCAGNKWVNTPAMDSIAAGGIRFEKSYCTNPVCLPSRFSFQTGYYPTAIGMRCNLDRPDDCVMDMAKDSMGWIFRKAGYRTVYGGKVHLPGRMSDVRLCGYEKLTGDERDGLADECVKFLKSKHDKPFLLFASFVNPHDICYMAIRAGAPESKTAKQAPEQLFEAMDRPAGMGEKEFYEKVCPPLPANFERTENEVAVLRDAIAGGAGKKNFRTYVREKWTEEDWRLHRWTYSRLTERVDGQIGRVLEALREAGLEKDTVVVFTSDHGEHDSAHRLEHKDLLYEESARIPFIISYDGVANRGSVDTEHLVCNGLDLLPTLCDVAGVEGPAGLSGRSLKPLIEGKERADWRESLVLESKTGFGLHTGRYKYWLFDCGLAAEMLFDLEKDPGEMKNVAAEKEYSQVVERLRAELFSKLRSRGVRPACISADVCGAGVS